MNTKFSTLKQSPLFYLALIPIVTLLGTLLWRMALGQADLYFYYSHLLSNQLALYLFLFFIVEAVINVFGNLNIIESVMTTNLMPFSSNAALWVLFSAFGFACWKMQKPQQR